MASYYRWNKKNISYNESPTSVASVSTPVYGVTSKPPIINGQYYFSGGRGYGSSQLDRGVWFKYGLDAGYSNVAFNYAQTYDDYNVYNVSGLIISQTAGSFIQYVYSTNQSAYPNGGASGNYWYDGRTGLDINITVPSLGMQGQNLTFSWDAVEIPNATSIAYSIQRNANNTTWETLQASTTDTSYTDTVQSTWTSVQYRVALILNGQTGSYTQSASIPIVSANALVISGQDQNLGTVTSNIPYTVSSNTGNPISLVRTVNGAQVVTLTVDSGFAYSIPIADLPTGTGTIQITASVLDSSSGQIINATRTWAYYKTQINFPSTGGIAQLTQNGQNIWPITIPDAVEAPAYLGGNLNSALNLLGQSILLNKAGTPKYSEVTINLSTVSVGDEINLPYNGVMVPHIVVQIGNPDASIYDSSCDGVWLLRKDCVAQGQWNSSGTNTLSGSTIMTTMAGYVSNYDTTVQNGMQTVKIPYCVGGGSSTVNTLANGLSCQIFPLSVYEVGFDTTIYSSTILPVDGAKLDYFINGIGAEANNKRIAQLNGVNNGWWPRSTYLSTTTYAWNITISGRGNNVLCTQNRGLRPCFIMPTTFNQTYYVDTNNNVYPAQEYITSSSVTDVFGYDVGISQIETGSYVGNGGSGSSTTSNSLIFSFTPAVVIIMANNAANNANMGIFLISNLSDSYVNRSYGVSLGTAYGGLSLVPYSGSTTSPNNYAMFSDKTLSWYSNNVNAQLNSSNITYYYVAIG